MRDRRITKRLVDNLKPTGDDHFVWDDTLIGFGVRLQATGAMSYVVKYRAGSGRGAPTRRMTIGRVGTLTPDEARTIAPALDYLGEGSEGRGNLRAWDDNELWWLAGTALRYRL